MVCHRPASLCDDASAYGGRLTLQSGVYVWPTVLFLGLGFALSKGLGYGCGNLRQYLLHALHALNPAFLVNDWFTTQTQAHHVEFNTLVVWAGKLIRLDVFFAAANATFAVIFVICIHLLAARLYRRPIIVTTIVVLCWVFGPTTQIGMTAIVSSYFQPSTIGAVGLLAGLTCLIYHRYRLAGAVLGTAAFFHINYMVWIVAILTVVVAINFRALGYKCMAFLVTPVLLAAVIHLPFIIAGRSPEQAVYSAAASRILHDIYMPYHSRPLTWGVQPFLRFAAVLAAGGVSLIVVGVQRPPGRIALSVLGAIAGIVVVGFVLTTAVQVDVVALLFPCRLSPLLVLAALIATAGAIATTAQFRLLSPTRTLALWLVLGALLYCGRISTYGLLGLGAAAAALFAGRLAKEMTCSILKLGILLAGLVMTLFLAGAGTTYIAFVIASAAGGLCWRIWNSRFGGATLGRPTQTGAAFSNVHPAGFVEVRRTGLRAGLGALLFAGPLVPLLTAALLMRLGSVRKDLLGPPPAPEEHMLYNWCQARTDPSDVFIVPPMLGGFRQGARRAVVIDWKCMPILPKDTVEWYRRLADECGTEFDSLSRAEAGYRAMSANQAKRLGDKYGSRYVVIERASHRGDMSPLPCVYRDLNFAVFDLGASRPASTAGARVVADAK